MNAEEPSRMSKNRILIVDDDAALRRLIADFLGENGYSVTAAVDAPDMRRQLAAREYDLIVLDLMMPGEDGLSALRAMGSGRPPVIMLSAMGTDVDRIIGLEVGADDYIAKPCNPRELLARIRAVLRRADSASEVGVFHFGGWRLDPSAVELFAPDGTLVPMTTNEWRILHALVGARRRVLSREELMNRLGGDDLESFDRSIDIAISRLRRKLAQYDDHEIVRTIRGEGYGLAVDVKAG